MIIQLLPKLAVLALAAGPLHADVLFGQVIAGPGKSINLVSNTRSEGGTIEVEKDGRVSKGDIVHSRQRDLSWTFREPAADGAQRGMLSVARISTVSTITLDGKPETTEDFSPLSGKMIAMSKPAGGDWKFELDESLELSGTLVKRSGKPGDSKTITLPLRLSVTKTIFGN